MSDSPLASVIILTYNNWAYTRQCLESIYRETQYPNFEVVVVDNASSDGTREALQAYRQKHANFTLLLNDTNKGFPAANNQGAALARGEYLVFLNNDTVVTRNWLSGLLRHLDDPGVGMVGPVTNRSGNETRIRTDYVDLDDMRVFAAEYTAAHAGQTLEVRTLPFLCVALRREVFEQIGPLDERFGVGMFEDDDYAMRLREAGYRLLCVEDVFVHHWGSAAFSLAGFARYWNLFLENKGKFERKWNVQWQPNRYRDEYLDEQIRMWWEEKSALAYRVITLQAELDSIHQSLTWHLLEASRRLQGALAPEGSRRAAALDSTARILRIGAARLNVFRKTWASRWREQKKRARLHTLRSRMKRELASILAAHREAREIIVFLPTVFWKTPLFQRPHQLALALAKQNCLVFFCEPPNSTDFVGQFSRIEKNLYVLGPAPLDIFKSIPSPVVFTLAYNRDSLRHFSAPRVIYEYIDDLSVLPGDLDVLQRNHADLVRAAEVVVATADNLYREVLPERPDALLCPNAADVSFIRRRMASTFAPPEDIRPLVESGRPVAGYYGALARWFDYRLLKRIARLRPEWHFLLIGLDYDGSIHKSRVLEVPNIHWTGPKPHEQIPAYLKYFDVATIPFRLNEITHATSPLKLFEYMAGGKPIVTTAMHECQKYHPVLIGENAADFAAKLDEAKTLQDDPEYQQSLARWAEQNSWEQRAAQILAALEHDGQG